MKRSPYALVALLLGLIALAIVALVVFDADDAGETPVEGVDDAFGVEDDWEDEGLFGLGDGEGGGRDGDGEGPSRPSMGGGEGGFGEGRGRRGMGMGGWRRRRDGGVDDAEWEARRARRRERFLQRIEVVSLGPDDPATTSEEIFDAFRDVRPLMRDCLREAGVERGAWRQMRSSSHTLTFDIDAQGGVVPGSTQMDPPLPDPFATCMRSSLEVLTVEPPGDDGARVSIEMPERRRRTDGGTR